MDSVLVSFPKMGLSFNVSKVAFRIFGQPIYWYGIIIAAAFLICVLWAMKDSTKYDLVPDTIIDLMLFAAPIAIICARLYFVIFSWENYRDDLKQILNVRNGGLAVYGGIIGAIATAYFVAKYKKIPTMKLFDFAIPYVALGQAIGRWGNFFNQEAFGTNTTLPWGMTSSTIKNYLAESADKLGMSGITINPELPVHPTFLYECIWDVAVFVFLMWMRKKKKFGGEVFCFYFITYSLGRAFIEGLRTDSLMIGGLRVSQMLSIAFVLVFGIFVIYKRLKVDTPEVEVGQSEYANVLKYMEEEERMAEAKKAEMDKNTTEAAESTQTETEDLQNSHQNEGADEEEAGNKQDKDRSEE